VEQAGYSAPAFASGPFLDGRVAIVTGAGRGIGRATARALAAVGARVMGVSRTESELVSLAEESSVEHMVESVATPEGCARIAQETRRRLGPIDILVNNAGIGSYRDKPIFDITPELWRETMAVNLEAPFELTRLAVGDMIERRWGRIVMVSSTAGEHGWQSMVSYCASKHGLLGLMRAVAQDVGPYDVTCNAVLPGWVHTQLADRKAELEAERRGVTAEEVLAEWAAEYPTGRFVTTEEVADTIVFLASPSASGINGEAVTIALGST
jgi:NAD(P)-dependent dehydrogenase (short-subunit alcohol dehydrogenase family)